MRRAPEPQGKAEPLPWQEPADFCYAPSWPKPAPGPPPIINPVQHSGNNEMKGIVLQSNAINSRKNGATSIQGGLKKMMSEGATRGQSEARLLCEYAANKNQSELSLLLKSGADPNVMSKVDWQPFETTPLLEACVSGFKRLARLLLEHGAKPDTVVGPGFTAIYNACMNGHYECVALLLEHGATVTKLTDEGFSPLYICAQNGHMDCVVLCLGASSMTKELADLGPPELGGATALYIAVQNGHPDCVHQLIKAGVNVDPVTEAGSTPLMIALYLADIYGDKPHTDCAALLLEAGASLDIKDKAGHTPLDWCGHDNSLIDMVVEEQKLRDRQKSSGQRGFW